MLLKNLQEIHEKAIEQSKINTSAAFAELYTIYYLVDKMARELSNLVQDTQSDYIEYLEKENNRSADLIGCFQKARDILNKNYEKSS